MNNGGCGIFSFLPIAAHADAFTPYFDTPHALSFAPLAAAFGLEYRRADTGRAWPAAYADAQVPAPRASRLSSAPPAGQAAQRTGGREDRRRRGQAAERTGGAEDRRQRRSGQAAER